MSPLPFYCLFLAYCLRWLLANYARRWLVLAFSGGYLVVLSLISSQLIPNWENDFKLWYMLSNYQEKYTHEVHPMYFRELILRNQRDLIEEVVAKENKISDATGQYKLNINIAYAQYLVGLGDKKGMVLMKKIRRQLFETNNDSKQLFLIKDYIFAMYQSLTLGALLIDHDVAAAEDSVGYARQFTDYINLKFVEQYAAVIAALRGDETKARAHLQQLAFYSKEQLPAYIAGADELIHRFCEHKPLPVKACKKGFSTTMWLQAHH